MPLAREDYAVARPAWFAGGSAARTAKRSKYEINTALIE
jgi:hypothetical protein